MKKSSHDFQFLLNTEKSPNQNQKIIKNLISEFLFFLSFFLFPNDSF